MKRRHSEFLDVFHSHPLILIAKWLVMVLLVICITGLIFIILPREITFYLLFAMFVVLVFFGLLLSSYTHWRVNTDIVTKENLVCIRFHGLFHFSIEEYAIWEMHSIDVRMEGFFQNVFSYGNVLISGDIVNDDLTENIVLKNIGHVHRLVEVLHQQMETLRKDIRRES